LTLYDGNATIENCLFSGNSSHRQADPNGAGGAIAVFLNGKASITNATFYANYSYMRGGAISNSGQLTVTNATFAGNIASIGGSAISALSATRVRNSIFSDNTLAGCTGDANLLDGGGNLRWPAEDSTCPGLAVNPQLQPLAGNGNNNLWSMALAPGSPAQRRATANCPATDQRGQPRAAAPRACDSGAYELQGYGLLPQVYGGAPAP
jgi:hypothetical protein